MSTISPVKVFSKTIASGVTNATFDVGGGYKHYMVGVPTLTSGSDIRFFVSYDEGTTFKALYHAPTVASATPTVVNIASSVSNAFVAVPPLGRHFMIGLTTTPTATAHTFQVLCIA